MRRRRAKIHLTRTSQRILLGVARKAIVANVLQKPAPRFRTLSPELNQTRGTFVSIHRGHKLRGCIGIVHSTKPLILLVSNVARAACDQDPRFHPVRPEELPDLQVEVSVLSQLKRVTLLDQIKSGEHGLLIRKQTHQGLLLPQVAARYHWDTITFLENACTKAQLPKHAWQSRECEIYVFFALVFRE